MEKTIVFLFLYSLVADEDIKKPNKPLYFKYFKCHSVVCLKRTTDPKSRHHLYQFLFIDAQALHELYAKKTKPNRLNLQYIHGKLKESGTDLDLTFHHHSTFVL